MSAARNRNEPASSTFAPAAAQRAPVSALMPPSTEMSAAGNRRATSAIFGTPASMKACPPKPGCTVMIRTSSSRSSNPCSAATGVSGFSVSPARLPAARMAANVARKSHGASTWISTVSAPASMNFGA